jgi:hypothetical protein
MMASKVMLGFVWELPDGLDSEALVKRLKELLKDGGIQVPLPHDLGLPADSTRFESFRLRSEEGDVIAVTGMTKVDRGIVK